MPLLLTVAVSANQPKAQRYCEDSWEEHYRPKTWDAGVSYADAYDCSHSFGELVDLLYTTEEASPLAKTAVSVEIVDSSVSKSMLDDVSPAWHSSALAPDLDVKVHQYGFNKGASTRTGKIATTMHNVCETRKLHIGIFPVSNELFWCEQ